jgi:hypothetical protein
MPPPGPPDSPGFQQYAVLTFTLGGGGKGAKLTLQGPKAPGIGLAPTIGIGLDKSGNYHFLIGAGDFAYPPKDVPNEIRRLLGGSGGGANGPPQAVAMPTADQLKRADGSFMDYDVYDQQRRMFHSGLPGDSGPIWIPLPRAVYKALIDFYSTGTIRLVPLEKGPKDVGDFPTPPSDTAVV